MFFCKLIWFYFLDTQTLLIISIQYLVITMRYAPRLLRGAFLGKK
jgi:hypothetical protein